MKISKALLGAILVGVAVQVTASSCTKATKIKPQAEAQQPTDGSTSTNHPPNNEPCPACGMG